MDSTIDQLERLAALHRSGSLSDTEYEAQKARLLGVGPSPQAKAAAAATASADKLSETWQRRFAFFQQHGSPFMPLGAKALQALPFGRQTSIRFNVWAFLFGPIYFAIIGVWRRGLALFLIAVAVGLVVDRLLGERVSNVLDFGWAALYALTANYARFIKVTQGRDEWNPLADFTGPAPDVRS